MSGSDPFEPSSPEPVEHHEPRPAPRRERPAATSSAGRARPSRRPNYRRRRFVAIGVVGVVALVAGVLVVRSILRDDPPAAEFSLADAAANAAKADLVDYQVTILVGDEVITTAEGMIDQRTGSTYLRVSSSIGASADTTVADAADTLGSAPSTSTSTPTGVASSVLPSTTAPAPATSSAVPVAASSSSVVSGLLGASAPSSTSVVAESSVTAGPSTTLDGPVVPDDPAQVDEATEVARYVDVPHQVVYVSSGAFAAAGLSFEQPWVRIDLAHLGKGVSVDLDSLAGLAGGDPLDVAPLLGASLDVTQIEGDAEVDGSPVKRYRVVVDGDQVVADVPAIAGQLEELDASAPDTLTFVVAVDAGNRIRRLTYEVSNGERTATTDIVFRVPAEDATIEFPDEADTIDFAEIVR